MGGEELDDLRHRFLIPDPDVAYLDGNSLGRPTVRGIEAVHAVLDEWATDLVEGWERWIDLPLQAGDALVPLLGRRPGSTIVCDSVTVNLHKAVHALVDAAGPGVVLAHAGDFPTDRYVLQGLAGRGVAVTWLDEVSERGVAAAVAEHGRILAWVGSAVSYTSAEVAPVAAITEQVHAAGGSVVWDVSHAVGAIPLALDDWGVDVAVGCTYKYLHGGPGGPGFVSLSAEAADRLRQPIQGWMGQREQFAMGADYDPVPGAGGWATGTPGVLGLVAAQAGIEVVAEAGIDEVRRRSIVLGRLLLDGWEDVLAPLGFELASPADDERRGGHVALRHADASRIVRAARTVGVVADFRAPDLVRLGPGPLPCTTGEARSGVDGIAALVRDGGHRRMGAAPGRVT
jgi:kynureninase